MSAPVPAGVIEMDLFKNIVINLKATGPAAVMIVWLLAVAALGLFGEGELAGRALTLLTLVGGGIVVSLAVRS